MAMMMLKTVVTLLCVLMVVQSATCVIVNVNSMWQSKGLNYANQYCSFTTPKAIQAGKLYVNVSLDKDISSFTDYDVFNARSNGVRWYSRQSKDDYNEGQSIYYSFEVQWTGAFTAPSGTCVNTITTATRTIKASSGSNSAYFYSDVIGKSMDFYAAQRSGDLPSNFIIPWRGDSALGDSGDNGEDLTGGYYDAGDHVKFGFPMAASMTVLAWGQYVFGDAYKDFGQSARMQETIKWGLDYFLKCWNPSANTFYGQVGNGAIDHAYWGRPEEMNMIRPAYKLTTSNPGSDLAAETAAALAAGYLVFNEKDQTYANTLLVAAESLFNFADTYRGKYSDSITDASGYYDSVSGFYDELMLASAILYEATGNQAYRTKAADFFSFASETAWAFSWDDKKPLAQLIMYNITSDIQYKTPVQKFLQQYRKEVSNDLTFLDNVLAWRDQRGSLRYAANAAFIALLAADTGLDTQTNVNWAKSQIDYMLGDNKASRSYVVGVGKNSPQRPYHRSSSCPDLPATCTITQLSDSSRNPQVLYGALVGGPDASGNYVDVRTDVQKNEVACDYNAGFTSALAGLVYFDHLL